jgi:hypothetical protein
MSAAHPIQTLADYYADPFVRLRMREYCGAIGATPATCVYFAAVNASDGPHASWDRASRFPIDAYAVLLSGGADIARSMWDRSNLLVHLDIDYQNVDTPGEPYHHSIEVFHKLEPVYRATVQVLRRVGLPLLALMTGRGYHFTGRVPLDSSAIDDLAALAPGPPSWVTTVAARRPPWTRGLISARHARAYVGIGMLMEFLAHRIMKRARRATPVPVVLNGLIVGSGIAGRECVSLDVSYAGDPLDVRHMRVAFGAYQKHRMQADLVANHKASERPPFVALPRTGASLEYLLAHGRDLRHAARAARTVSARLPNAAVGVAHLLDAYTTSALARFHREFYATPPQGPSLEELQASRRWSQLPECVRAPLVAPNDRLLQPTVIQHVTRVLMADGLSARDVAAIVYSRYAADCGWGRRWFWLDARTRAEFDVRVFAGLTATGLDRGIDFNCRSAQEKGLCPGKPCPLDLRVNRQRLLDRVAT